MRDRSIFSRLFALLFTAALAGCAAESARRPTADQRVETKKDAFPTFTYRPGG